MMSTHEAVHTLRRDPAYAQIVRDTYLDADVNAAAERFAASGEFAAVMSLIGSQIPGAVIVDLGAGNGIASYAFARAGAAQVIAVEPDPSDDIGRGAAARLCAGLPVDVREGVGESLPVDDSHVDLVYARQVLHHTQDLAQVMREAHRVLKPGGVLLACREHVADDAAQLAAFLAAHPIHQLAGGEHAYRLDEYSGAITGAGFQMKRVFGMWESVINAYPAVNTPEELAAFPLTVLTQKLGVVGRVLGAVPGVQALVWQRIKRPTPGRLYTFWAQNPR